MVCTAIRVSEIQFSSFICDWICKRGLIHTSDFANLMITITLFVMKLLQLNFHPLLGKSSFQSIAQL